MEFFGITWSATQHIWWLPVVLVAIAIFIYRFKKRQHAFALLSSSVFAKLVGNTTSYNNIAKILCLSAGLFFLFLAFVGPQGSKIEERVRQESKA